MELRRAWVRFVAAMVLPAVAFAGTLSVYAADEKTDAKVAAKEPAAKEGVKKDRKGPLPFYYGDLVSPEQREKIYAIQEKYKAQVAEAQAKVKEIETARNKEIEAVLTAEQIEKVNKAKADAAAKRAATAVKKPDAPKADGEKPAAPKTDKPATGN